MVLSLTEKLKQIKLNMGGEELSLEDKLKQIKMNLQETTPTETTGLSLEEKLSKIKTNIGTEAVQTPVTTPIVGAGLGLPSGLQSTPEMKPVPESKIKDVWDAVRLSTSKFVQDTKQFFSSALPNLIFQDTNPKETRALEQKYGLPTGSITDETIEKLNTKNKEKRDIYEAKYKKADDNYKKWLEEHPELIPREEWREGAIATIKKNPKVLLDPAFWLYHAANSISFSYAVKATTLAVGIATGNPLLAIVAGTAVTYPSIAQNLNEELIANGATPEQAAELSVPIGGIIASVESLGDLPFLAAVSPTFKKLLNKNISNAVVKGIVKKGFLNTLKKGAITVAKIELSETFEEVVQGAIQDATLQTVNENIDILKNIPETIVQTLIATAPTALIGGASDIRNITLNQKIDKIQRENIIETQSEQKEIVTPEAVTEKVTEGVTEAPAPPVTGKGKVSKIAGSIEAKSIEQGLTKGYGHLAEYTPIVIKEQAQKATDLINSDIDEARKIIRGEKPLPEGLKGTALITAMEEHIKKTADGELASELANSPLVSGTSVAAQELRLAAERDPESPVKAIADVNKLLEERAKKKFPGKILTKAKSDLSAKYQSEIKSEVKKTNTRQSWQTFIESIRC